MTTEKINHQVCYELEIASIQKIQTIAEDKDVSVNEALTFLIDYAFERYDPNWDYKGDRTINPRKLENTLEELSNSAACFYEELSELWLIAKNAE